MYLAEYNVPIKRKGELTGFLFFLQINEHGTAKLNLIQTFSRQPKL